MSEAWDRMVAGELYRADHPDLVAAAHACIQRLSAYNAISETDEPARQSLLKALCASVGDKVVVRSPFHCDYGRNITLGDGVFINFGAVILDVAPVMIGDGAEIGPYVQVLTADHPRDPEIRRQRLEFGRPISISPRAWIGGGAIILPGTTIGEGAIIGAGAVVTRDVPAGATAVGNPARVR